MVRHTALTTLAALIALAITVGAAAQPTTDVLLIQTSAPWGTASNETCLNGLGLTYDLASDWSQVDWAHLGDFRVVLVVNDQAQTFYDGHAANMGQLETFVEDGGDLLFFAAGAGWAGGQLTAPLPGGLPWNFTQAPGDYAHFNTIVDYTHPIVTSQLSDNIPLTDAVMDGNYCSHGWFAAADLLPETRIIFRQSTEEGGNPTTIDYRVGQGHVVASTNTWEFHYDGLGYQSSYHGDFAIQNLDDVFLYMLAVGGVTAPDAVIYQHYITTDPDCFDGEVEAGTQVTVTSLVSNMAAVAITDMNVVFSYMDEAENEFEIGTVTGQAIPEDGQIETSAVWDTTDVEPGTYQVAALAEVLYPEELLENQDNNWSARNCTITIGTGDDDDATPPGDDDDDDDDDDDGADDDDDDDGGYPGMGCNCNSTPARTVASATVILSMGLILAGIRRRR